MNLANKLTVFRVILIPFFLLALYLLPEGLNHYVGTGIFIIASLTDWLDGYIARSRNLVTSFGKFMDPLADKLLVAAALIYMVEAGDLSAWVVIIIISREFFISGYRLVASLEGKVISAGWWGKVKTAVTMVMIIVVLFNIELSVMIYFESVLIYAAAALTIISAVDYVIKNKGVISGGL